MIGILLIVQWVAALEFIQRKDGVLYENRQVFRFASFNVPNLLLTEDRGSKSDTLFGIPICNAYVANPTIDSNGYARGDNCIIPKTDEADLNSDRSWLVPTVLEQEDAILSIKGANGRVIRTYTMGFGNRHHFTSPTGTYEPAFRAMDNAIALAAKHGVRLIIPFINNHNGGDATGPELFGDYTLMCAFRGLKPSAFYTSRTLIDDLKRMISYTLNRVNTVTGVRYGDDPAILAWELGNELGGESGAIPPVAWTLEIATHFKTLAPRTLVMDGTYGFQNLPNRIPKEVMQSRYIDIIGNHYFYGDSDLTRIASHADFVTRNKKVFIVSEFGFGLDLAKKIYTAALNNRKVTGAMIWSFRFHARDGGHYVHQEWNGFFSYHAPGLAYFSGFNDGDDQNMAQTVRGFGLQMQGLSTSTAFPTPAPVRAPAGTISPRNLRWFGSSWAGSYVVSRKVGTGSFQFLANVVDNKPFGIALFSDPVPAGVYSYMIVPVSVDGKQNAQSPLVLGPFQVL